MVEGREADRGEVEEVVGGGEQSRRCDDSGDPKHAHARPLPMHLGGQHGGFPVSRSKGGYDIGVSLWNYRPLFQMHR